LSIGEGLGMRLASLHNLRFVFKLVKSFKKAKKVRR